MHGWGQVGWDEVRWGVCGMGGTGGYSGRLLMKKGNVLYTLPFHSIHPAYLVPPSISQTQIPTSP